MYNSMLVTLRVFLFTLLFFVISSCKTTKPPATIVEQPITDTKTKGIVSHKFKKGACASTVIIIKADGNEMVLIPKDPLPPEFDKDGIYIKFNYRKLRMPNPEGCEVGGMAELSSIEKSN